MKKLFLFAAMFSLLAACTQQVGKKGPLEGVWKMQHARFSYPDTSIWWEADEMNMQTKIFTEGYFAFVNLYPSDDEDGSGSTGGSGTYIVMGDTLIETMEIMEGKASIGASVAYLVTISGDTLVQEGPIAGTAPDAWEGFQLKEVYLRVE
jgi:hypothetical protein